MEDYPKGEYHICPTLYLMMKTVLITFLSAYMAKFFLTFMDYFQASWLYLHHQGQFFTLTNLDFLVIKLRLFA